MNRVRLEKRRKQKLRCHASSNFLTKTETYGVTRIEEFAMESPGMDKSKFKKLFDTVDENSKPNFIC